MNRLKYIVNILIAIFMLSSCYKEEIVYESEELSMFSFEMDDSLYSKVQESRGIRYDILPVPRMKFNGEKYDLDKLRVRGQTTTNYQRKSFAVNLDDEIAFSETPGIFYEKLKLISMVADYTYIENRLSHKLLQTFDLWPLKTFYTQVSINGNHQGLYLMIEDPEDHFILQKNADAMIRRYYRNGITELVLSDTTPYDSAYFAGEFKSLYKYITQYEGEALYDSLSRKLNIKHYMQKLAVDFFLMNGDYTDEISFSATVKNGVAYFDAVPWDYDDIFASQPHEIDRNWSVGKLFGNRYYANYDEWKAIFGNLLMFSIEDDLDYTIATDSVLYKYYLQELKTVFARLNSGYVSALFDELKQELDPFYTIPEVIEQSQFDVDATSRELFENNLIEKEQLLQERLIWINQELEKQLN